MSLVINSHRDRHTHKHTYQLPGQKQFQETSWFKNNATYISILVSVSIQVDKFQVHTWYEQVDIQYLIFKNQTLHNHCSVLKAQTYVNRQLHGTQLKGE